MRTATTTAAIQSIEKPEHHAQRASALARIGGIAIASLVPAVFWSVLIALASLWLDHPLTPGTIAIVGGAIALFLFTICAPLMLLRQSGAEPDSEVDARGINSNT